MNKNVLIVDDNVDHAKSLTMLMRLSGYQAESACDGESALEAADKANPDIVLLDIGLPTMDGHEVCRLIRKRPWGERTLVVAITGYGNASDREKSFEAGFNAHFTKPLDFHELLKLLDDSAG